MKNDSPTEIDALREKASEFESLLQKSETSFAEYREYENFCIHVDSLSMAGLSNSVSTPELRQASIENLCNELDELGTKLLAKLSIIELTELIENDDADAAMLLRAKYHRRLGASDEWIDQNHKNLTDWGEVAIIGCKERGLSWRKWDLANEYIEIGNFKRAIVLLKEAVDEGEIHAAFILGSLYFEGDIEPNGELAKKYLELAASEKYEIAQVALARLYLRGDIIEEDLRQTFELAREAKLSGSDEGKELLGYCFEFGWGTRQNRPKAYRLYQELGVDFSAEMRRRIADDYLEGISVKKDTEKGLQILHEAAKDDDGLALTALAKMYAYGFDVVKNQSLAFEYAYRAVHTEEAPARAMLLLGSSYFLGEGTEVDHQKAAYWLQLARANADTEMQKLEAEVWLEDELGLTLTNEKN